MTTIFVDMSMIRRIMLRWIGVGLGSTVWSVVTIGISRRDKSSMMFPPA